MSVQALPSPTMRAMLRKACCVITSTPCQQQGRHHVQSVCLHHAATRTRFTCPQPLHAAAAAPLISMQCSSATPLLWRLCPSPQCEEWAGKSVLWPWMRQKQRAAPTDISLDPTSKALGLHMAAREQCATLASCFHDDQPPALSQAACKRAACCVLPACPHRLVREVRASKHLSPASALQIPA